MSGQTQGDRPSSEGQSKVNASQMIGIFTDYDERGSPYEGRAVQISVTADVLFIYPGKLVEERGSSTFTFSDDEVVGVDAQAFYEALGSILRREDRSNADHAREGTLLPTDPAHTVVPVVTHVPGVRRRA